MNKYELTLFVSGKATPAKQKSVVDKVKKITEIFKGKVEKVNEWGKIDLMYRIKANEVGVFFLFDIELDPLEVKKYTEKLRMEEEILRFLVVKK